MIGEGVTEMKIKVDGGVRGCAMDWGNQRGAGGVGGGKGREGKEG